MNNNNSHDESKAGEQDADKRKRKRSSCNFDSTKHSSSRTTLLVHSTPRITDPRELETILRLSLKKLYGDLECYSYDLNVQTLKTPPPDSDCQDIVGLAVDKLPGHCSLESILQVECPTKFAQFIRAALTWNTLPSYMDELLYRMDVVVSSSS